MFGDRPFEEVMKVTMRSYGGVQSRMSDVLIRGNLDTQGNTRDVRTQTKDCEDTARRPNQANEGERSQEKPNLPIP